MKNALYLTSFLLLCSFNLASAITLKVAVLAPDGTTWAKNIMAMAKEVKKATDGKVKFKVYLGGVQGDEPDVLRKIRINQLHGGIFTGRALGDINGDVRIMEVPFTFVRDREKAFATLSKLSPFFNSGFEKNDFKNLGFFEIGNVYLISTKPASSINELKGIKIWAWSGDDIVATMVNEMNLVSVPLGLPDVLSSLSTGIIEAAYSSPLGVLALQWNTKVKYLLDYPITYSVGAFLLSAKAWKKVPKEHKKTVEDIAIKYTNLANEGTIKENAEAKETLKNIGIKFLELNEKDMQQGSTIRTNIIKKLTGKLFSPDAVKRFETAKAEK